jgi:hypothetical protein
LKIRIATDWYRSNDPSVPTNEIVNGRMVEFEKGDKWIPAIEHKIEGGESINRDVSYTWAVASKWEPHEFAAIRSRFSRVFDAYESELKNREIEQAKQEAEIQARIDAEVAKKLADAEKAKPTKVTKEKEE